MESRRQEFEVFVLRCGYPHTDLQRAGNGYWHRSVDRMWKTWNAALDSLAAQS